MTDPAAAGTSFKDFWSSTVFPFKDDFERLLSTIPTRIQERVKKPKAEKADAEKDPKEPKVKKEPKAKAVAQAGKLPSAGMPTTLGPHAAQSPIEE